MLEQHALADEGLHLDRLRGCNSLSPCWQACHVAAVDCTDRFIVLRSEGRVSDLELLLELLDYDQVVQVLCCELGLCLLLAGNLLLLQFLHFEFQLVEVQRAFFFRPVQLLAMELLKTAILLYPLL